MSSPQSRRQFLLSAAVLAGVASARRASAQTRDEIDAVAKLLEEGKEEFLKLINEARDEEWNLRVGGVRHTIGDEAEHIALSENSLQNQVKLAVREGIRESLARPLVGKENELKEFFAQNVAEGYRPRKKMINRAEVLEFYGKANRNLMKLLREAEDLSKVVYKHPSPKIGELTGLQWFYYIAYHRLRHINQIKTIMAHEDFPRRVRAA